MTGLSTDGPEKCVPVEGLHLLAQVQRPADVAVHKFENGPGGDLVEEDDAYIIHLDYYTDDNAPANKVFDSYLDTHDIPDPDLMIRTSGELRLSNYLLWQLAYSEFYFTDVPWPDFNKKELERAVEAYNKRDRRFGGLTEE